MADRPLWRRMLGYVLSETGKEVTGEFARRLARKLADQVLPEPKEDVKKEDGKA